MVCRQRRCTYPTIAQRLEADMLQVRQAIARLCLPIRARFCPTRNKQKVAKQIIELNQFEAMALTENEVCDRVEAQLRELEAKFD